MRKKETKHFINRKAFTTNPACIGIGIEQNTAIVTTSKKNARVVGSGVVVISDGEESHGSNIASYDEPTKITIRELKISILSHAETFEIPERNLPHVCCQGSIGAKTSSLDLYPPVH